MAEKNLEKLVGLEGIEVNDVIEISLKDGTKLSWEHNEYSVIYPSKIGVEITHIAGYLHSWNQSYLELGLFKCKHGTAERWIDVPREAIKEIYLLDKDLQKGNFS